MNPTQTFSVVLITIGVLILILNYCYLRSDVAREAITRRLKCPGCDRDVYLKTHEAPTNDYDRYDYQTCPCGTSISVCVNKNMLTVPDDFPSVERPPIGTRPDLPRPYTCDVCEAPLTEDEIQEQAPHHFSVCCAKHARYRTAFNIPLVRRQLGITPRPKEGDTGGPSQPGMIFRNGHWQADEATAPLRRDGSQATRPDA